MRASDPARRRQRRVVTVVAPVVLLVTTVVVAYLLAFSAWSGRTPALLEIPLVELSFPVVRGLTNLSSAAVIGSLVVAAAVLPTTSAFFGRVMDVAASAAGAWSALVLVSAVLAYFSLAGPVAWNVFPQSFAQVLGEVGLGQAYLVTALSAAVIAVCCFAVRSPALIATLLIAALATLVPLALQGHAAGAGSHSAASSGLWMHAASAAVWIGGLGVTAWLLASRIPSSGLILQRFSTIALGAYIVLALSGLASAMFRLTEVSDLWSTTYGQLIVLKAVALIGLGAAGAVHRRFLIRRLSGSASVRSQVLRLVVAELAVMGIASAAAAALSRTATPVQESLAVSPSQRLLGQPLPDPLTVGRMFTSWTIEPVWAIGVVAAVALYGFGVLRARQQGNSWPWGSVVFWLIGAALLLFAANGAPAVYGPYLYSQHVLGQGLLVVAAVFLGLGRPVTLALDVLPRRTDTSRGRREWVYALLSSRTFGALTHPIVAAVLLITTSWAFSRQPLLLWSLDDPLGRQWMIGQFLAVGCLYFISQRGRRNGEGARRGWVSAVALTSVLVSYTLLGLTLLTSTGMLLPEWYGQIAQGWSIDPAEDQRAAGIIVLVFGPASAVVIVPTILIDETRHRRHNGRSPLPRPPRGPDPLGSATPAATTIDTDTIPKEKP
jgi:putative copper resistance protein D